MKYLGGSFSVYPGENKNYRDNYDKIFGKKADKPEPKFDDKPLPPPRDAQPAPSRCYACSQENCGYTQCHCECHYPVSPPAVIKKKKPKNEKNKKNKK